MHRSLLLDSMEKLPSGKDCHTENLQHLWSKLCYPPEIMREGYPMILMNWGRSSWATPSASRTRHALGKSVREVPSVRSDSACSKTTALTPTLIHNRFQSSNSCCTKSSSCCERSIWDLCCQFEKPECIAATSVTWKYRKVIRSPCDYVMHIVNEFGYLKATFIITENLNI